MLYCFDKNEELLDELGASDLSQCTQIEELNKLMVLEFAVYIKNYDSMKVMSDTEFVAHKDAENPNKIQMYRITSSETDAYTINYQAIHVLFDDLKSYGYIRDKRGLKVKASSALETVLDGSRWKVGRVDDTELKNINFYDCTRLEGLSEILTTWGLDLSYDLEFRGSKITSRRVHLLGQRGEDTGERFVYGSNALEVVKELDKSEVYTRVIPRGKGEEKHDEEGKPTDGYGRRIQITDIEWSTSKGDPIDKPKGQEFLELPEMTQLFGFSDGEPRSKVVVFEDIERPEELIQAGYDYLVEVSRPLVQFKTQVYKKSATTVGDIVRVIRRDLDIYYRTRIYKATRNLLSGGVEVEFGDKLLLSQGEREKGLLNSIGALKNRMEEAEVELRGSFIDRVTEELTNATFNRDGFNYELKAGNKYNLPAGYYSFDREIDDNPQRVIYVGAGTLAIADSKKSNGDWDFRTFGTGQGFTADLLVAGMIVGGKVRWNLEDGTFLIGNSLDDYNLYWDGSTLNLRNVDIDLENNKAVKEIKNKQDQLVTDITDAKFDNTNTKALVTKLRTDFKIQAGEISSKVSRGEVISEINQSPEQIKIDASKIDLTGNVSVVGSFSTKYNSGSPGINIWDNQIEFSDDRWQRKKFGRINVTKEVNSDDIVSLNIGHYDNGRVAISYYDKDDGLWSQYITFDHYNIREDVDITVWEKTVFKDLVTINQQMNIGGQMRIKKYQSGVGIENWQGSGLYIDESGDIYVSRNNTIRKVLTE